MPGLGLAKKCILALGLGFRFVLSLTSCLPTGYWEPTLPLTITLTLTVAGHRAVAQASIARYHNAMPKTPSAITNAGAAYYVGAAYVGAAYVGAA